MGVHTTAKCNEGAAQWPPIHTQAPIISLNVPLFGNTYNTYNIEHKYFRKDHFIQSTRNTHSLEDAI